MEYDDCDLGNIIENIIPLEEDESRTQAKDKKARRSGALGLRADGLTSEEVSYMGRVYRLRAPDFFVKVEGVRWEIIRREMKDARLPIGFIEINSGGCYMVNSGRVGR